MNGNTWNQYIYDLQQYMNQQENTIKRLENRINKLENDLKEKNNPSIGKIEYKFDQLKIERLDGTLHIGLTPSDLENIEDFGVHQPNLPNHHPPLKQSLTSELHNYVQETGPILFNELSKQYHTMIDDSHQSILLEDIIKQLPSRVAFHEQEAKRRNPSGNEEQLRTTITEEIKKEIHQSLQRYMKSIEQEGEEH